MHVMLSSFLPSLATDAVQHVMSRDAASCSCSCIVDRSRRVRRCAKLTARRRGLRCCAESNDRAKGDTRDPCMLPLPCSLAPLRYHTSCVAIPFAAGIPPGLAALTMSQYVIDGRQRWKIWPSLGPALLATRRPYMPREQTCSRLCLRVSRRAACAVDSS